MLHRACHRWTVADLPALHAMTGGLRNMVAVKRAPRDAARSFIVDICVTIPKKVRLRFLACTHACR